ncbi:MAG: tRNA (N6-threonylcarbamoyladenosine(37)-N6)-methyltransferase TrmO [Methanothrix sp.]|nr:tRNA (N6-threonylcarbamoyladenosine(37)-N6)-methyltransferase TrmO [Methanothrix sp.]OPX79882.1 MAG: S-adenosyl-L-methionine-binding protein [Methanosaeta sp. PtaB.Bin087]OPY49516.1 MAG: S-adenosyl-L-methionine-binding protein [Methanosaeta sp. PtaU1.Bin055]NLX39512.1 tRNA (N6-threonylcarbamoyladenosine(37)-N6)-methyltransferase TrmO [Methanothrix sp.]HNT71489.1 tRNA (N6-threonylcarbamoyladenosine(37)-N6)-methyltransferase TrmO [Methanothrix sp.]
MNFEPVIFTPIGVVHCDFGEPADPKTMRNSLSTLEIDEKYREALAGIENYRHLFVIYYIHRALGYDLMVHPMGDESIPKRGLFATRTPRRPNPIGLTVVEVLNVEGMKITVTGLDALDGSPILDIKPYEEHYDSPRGVEAERDPGYSPKDG